MNLTIPQNFNYTIINKSISDIEIINTYCNINDDIITKFIIVLTILFLTELSMYLVFRRKDLTELLNNTIVFTSFLLCIYLLSTQFKISLETFKLIHNLIYYGLIFIIVFTQWYNIKKYFFKLVKYIKEKEK